MITRRTFLKGMGATVVAGVGMTTYAFGIEPRFRLQVTTYRLHPPRWPTNSEITRIAVVADIHACEPWMPEARIEEIVAVANGLEPDLTVLLGDYASGISRFRTGRVKAAQYAPILGRLRARLGVRAILGNHDWWSDAPGIRDALEGHGVPVLENRAERFDHADGSTFWLAGLGDQLAIPNGRGGFDGVDDLPGTLAQVTDDGPVVLLAHEPDIFAEVPDRVGLTLAGHTHGGQVNIPFFGRPIVPSAYGERFAYGHIIDDDRHLVVSGGLGCSILPVRFRVPPEIVLVELGASQA
ncbi:metallophosphoesterase [Bauldia sp.]|uniref:metallophosphoesterase n=1 Tax=Bauldia sp. TaxID=2575872 RepID=UPI003BA880F3